MKSPGSFNGFGNHNFCKFGVFGHLLVAWCYYLYLNLFFFHMIYWTGRNPDSKSGGAWCYTTGKSVLVLFL